MTETVPELRSLRQHKEIPFVWMDLFKGSPFYQALAETERFELYKELCELRALFDLHDVSLGDEPATAAELAILGQFRQSVSRLAALARDTSPAAARAIGSLEAAAHAWASARDPSKSPFEPGETGAFVFINRLLQDMEPAAQIAGVAERPLEARAAAQPQTTIRLRLLPSPALSGLQGTASLSCTTSSRNSLLRFGPTVQPSASCKMLWR